MDTALSPDGDYILGENGIPVKIYDTKELLQKILIKLTTKIGSFIYDTNLGSDLYTLKDAEDSEEIIKQKANVIVKKILCNVPQAELKNVEIQYINENDENSVKTLEFKIFLIINKKTETLVVKV